MAGNGGRVAGIVSIVLSLLIAAWDVLAYLGRHPRRGLAIAIACGLLFVLGIVLVIAGARKPVHTPQP